MKNNGYVWGVAIAVLLVAGFFIFSAHKASAPSPTASSTATTSSTGSTTNVNLGGGTSVQAPTGVTITPVSSITEPNLNYQVTYSASVSPDMEANLKTQIPIITAALNNDPTNANNWLQLALDYKLAGDYTAAANVWTYLTKVAPTNYVAYGDLGDLYQNFDVNYTKAEANYKAAIAIDPTVPDYYADLYYLYGMEKNPAAQSAILAQGLKANPNDNTLLALQKGQ